MYGLNSNGSLPFCSALILLPVTIFLNILTALPCINSSPISSPILASFPKSILVENLSPNSLKSKALIFLSPKICAIKSRNVLFPFDLSPVSMKALPNSFRLKKVYPIHSSNSDLICLSLTDNLFNVLSVKSL